MPNYPTFLNTCHIRLSIVPVKFYAYIGHHYSELFFEYQCALSHEKPLEFMRFRLNEMTAPLQ